MHVHQVWQLADPRKEGFLDRDGFTVALSLISVAQQGKRLALESLRPGKVLRCVVYMEGL